MAIHQPAQPKNRDGCRQIGRVEPGVGLDERELDPDPDDEQQPRREDQIRAVVRVFGSRYRGDGHRHSDDRQQRQPGQDQAAEGKSRIDRLSEGDAPPSGPGRWSPGTEVLLGSASVTDGWREAIQRQSRAYFPAVACWPGGGGSAQFLRPLQDRAKPDAWSP